MPIIKYDENGELYAAPSSNMNQVGRGVYPMSDPDRQGVIVNSLNPVLKDEKLRLRNERAEAMSERMQLQRRLIKDAKDAKAREEFESEALQNDEVAKAYKKLKNKKFAEAVMQGADYNNTEYMEYPSNLPRDPRSDWEGYKMGVPFNMPVDTGSNKGMTMGRVRDYSSGISGMGFDLPSLADITGINIDLSKGIQQKAQQEIDRAINQQNQQPNAPIIISAPSGQFAQFFNANKTLILAGGAVVVGLILLKVLKK